MRLWQPVREVTEKLRHLASLRERLEETKKKLLTPVEELSKVGNEMMAKMLSRSMNKTITGLEKDLDAIEKQMKDIIDSDDDLRKLYALVSSVIGIGFVTAVNLIIATAEFKLFHWRETRWKREKQKMKWYRYCRHLFFTILNHQ